MKEVELIKELDRKFINTENQKIIDSGMDILESFSKERDQLIAELFKRFSEDNTPNIKKETCYKELELTTQQVFKKIKEVQSLIKSQNLKLIHSKKIYSDTPNSSDSFFINKMV